MTGLLGDWLLVISKLMVMAVLTGEALTNGFSGKLGKQVVFRQRNGKTIICNYPQKSKKPLSDLQKNQHKRFADAVAYAKEAISDDIQRAALVNRAGKGMSACNLAVKDYLSGNPCGEVEPMNCYPKTRNQNPEPGNHAMRSRNCSSGKRSFLSGFANKISGFVSRSFRFVNPGT